MKKLFHEFPPREEYKYKKGKSAYDGPIKNLNLAIEDRHKLPIQEFLWLDWLFKSEKLQDKYKYFELLAEAFDGIGIKDYSLTFINKMDKTMSIKFVKCIRQMYKDDELLKFGFIYFDNPTLKREYYEKEYEKIKYEIDKYINNIYDKNEAEFLYFAAYFNFLKNGKLCTVNEEIRLAEYAYGLEVTEKHKCDTLKIQNLVKTIYMGSEFPINDLLWNRLTVEECTFMKFDNNSNLETLDIYLKKFIKNQYYFDKLEYNEFEKKVNQGLINYLYDLSCDLINLKTSSGKYSVLKTIMEVAVMLCYLKKEKKENDNIYSEYINYGNSKIANVSIKFDDEITRNLLKLALEKNIVPSSVIINHDYFSGNVKHKFKDIGEDELYEKYYEITNLYTHALWPAVYNNSFTNCLNNIHNHDIFSDDIIDVIDVYKVCLECWAFVMQNEIAYINKVEL